MRKGLLSLLLILFASGGLFGKRIITETRTSTWFIYPRALGTPPAGWESNPTISSSWVAAGIDPCTWAPSVSTTSHRLLGSTFTSALGVANAYFYTKFNVDSINCIKGLTLNYNADDSAYFWLNGNMIASGGAGGNVVFTKSIPKTNLIAGTNVLTVTLKNFMPGCFFIQAELIDTGYYTKRTEINTCLKGPLVLHGVKGATSYEWQNGSIADSYLVSTEGTYWVRSSDSCGTITDTFVVKNKMDTITAGRDTMICLKQPFVLYGVKGLTSYKWQDGSTADSFVVSTEGTYRVQSSDSCRVIIDTIVVKHELDTARSSRDTMICKTGVLVLKPNKTPPAATYIWSTGSTNNSITISKKGTYWVEAKEECNLTIDSIIVAEVDVTADIAIDDTIICQGDTLLVWGNVSPAVAKTLWSTGDTTLTVKASAKGKYVLSAEFTGCKVEDDIYIDYFPGIYIELGEDREICGGDVLTLPKLSSSEQGDKYLWQDGSTDRKYNVTQAGRYTVRVTGSCGTLRDTVTITARNCRLYFPDVFSPNGDGHNDRARLLGDIANLSNYELHIFHRWGEEVFTSTDLNNGWDGMHQGTPAAQATYYYYIKFRYFGNDEIMKGSLILLR